MERITFALSCDTKFAASIYVNDQILCIASTVLGKLAIFLSLLWKILNVLRTEESNESTCTHHKLQ